MDIGELIKTQNRLTQAQIALGELIRKMKFEDVKIEDIDLVPKHEIVNGVLKLIVPEYPPKINVFHKLEIVDGTVVSNLYQEARNRWYSLIFKALEGYDGGRIDPAIVYMVYYVPWICDVGNFVGKMIVDGLMYAGAIGVDDNLEHVPVEIQEARLDKENPRTEIYVIEYKNQLEKILIPWNELEKYRNEVEKLKAEIKELEDKKVKIKEESRVNL